MDAPDLPPEQIAEFNANFEAGTSCVEKIMRLHENPRGIFGFFARRRARRAIVHLERCLEIFPGSWQSMWFLGKAHQSLDEHDRALEWFEKALSIEKINPDVPREASLAALSMGIALKAEKYAREACKRSPQDAGLASNLALALLIGHNLDEALAAASRAVKMDPDDQVCHTVLAYASKVKSGELPAPTRIGPELP